ncbi:hypothetical protein [Allosalinactinospora lopnorensis]|uniref:hypothetical protein n=1 Tax=Allosalinactinospora lopnorensis TaxID=1352348 RepID=UPI000623E6B5|nr:hypothetical protein [Allosalinactinospora lopnorensis]
MPRPLLRGAMAGAAGTTALNAVTYLDMALRARPASTTPEQTVQRFEDLAGVSLAKEGSDTDEAANRRSGLGALLGISTGIGTGLLYGAARARWPRAPFPLLALGASVAANLGSVVPMSTLGVTDPREWPASSWLMDIVPHLAYGVTTAVAYDLLSRPPDP